MKRDYIIDIFKKNKENTEVLGWVSNIRNLGNVKFLILKDPTGFIQITAINKKTNKETLDKINKISKETIISVKGKVKNSGKAPGGKEILPTEIEILNKADTLPFDVSEYSKTNLSKRLNYRFLDLHRLKIQAIFKIQSEITHSFREYFYNKGFIEVQLPSIISSASEGGTELFQVNYFKKKAFLAQSPQLYKQMTAVSLEKVFTITPVWRAEKHNTIRHLNESRQMDIEEAHVGQMQVMKELTKVVQYIIKNILKKNKEEIKLLKLNLKIPKEKYLSYDEVVKILKIKYGEDLTPENEKQLNKLFPETIVFVHSWPRKIKPFYIMPKDEDINSKLSEGFDAIYRGMEISSGGQRIHLPGLLKESIISKGLNPKDFKDYITSFKFGAPKHSGWSIGLERLTQLIVEKKNIREAVLFPRDRNRLTP